MNLLPPECTREIIIGSRTLPGPAADGGIHPEWVIAVGLYESGLNPANKFDQPNPAVARGMFARASWWNDKAKVWVPYGTRDALQQVKDAFAFWRQMTKDFNVKSYDSLDSFYCLNLAPARLQDGKYDSETVLYDAKKHPKEYYPNRQLDRDTPKRGWIKMSDLGHKLTEEIEKYWRVRYDAEVAALAACTDSSPTDV